MSTKKTPAKKTAEENKPTPLQAYLAKPLPPFQRGTADCGAFVAGWINSLTSEGKIEVKPMTFGEVKRQIVRDGMAKMASDKLEPLGWTREKEAKDGDVVVYEQENSLGSLAVGIMSDGAAVTRMEDDKLHLTKNPKTISIWRAKS